MEVEISKLKPHPFNAEVYGEIDDGGLKDIINSMQTQGQLEPIIVNQDFVIISGHRRFEAAKRLKYETVEVRQETMRPEAEPGRIISYNIKREKKASMIIREYQHLSKMYGSSQGFRSDIRYPLSKDGTLKVQKNTRRYVAEILKISEGTLADLLYVSKNMESMIEEIDKGNIAISSAAKFVKERKRTASRNSDNSNSLPVVVPSHPRLIFRVVREEQQNYSDRIVEAFLKIYHRAKAQSDVNLEDCLSDAIASYEQKVDDCIARDETVIFLKFDDIQNLIRKNKYHVYKIFSVENIRPAITNLQQVDLNEFIRDFNVPDFSKNLKGDAWNMYIRFRDSAVAYIHNYLHPISTDCDFVVKPNGELSEIEFEGTAKEDVEQYLKIFSAIYSLKKEMRRENLNRNAVAQLNKQLKEKYEELRLIVRRNLGYYKRMKNEED